MNRRGLLAAAAAFTLAPAAIAAEPHPSLAYMRKAAKDLLDAHRIGTVASFLRVIQRYADIPQIALYSLGQYQPRLPEAMRERYYHGVAVFMSRYFALQSRDYPVAKYEIGGARTDGQDVLIDTKVYLMSGSTYNVVWRLSWKGKTYKISDVKILGFSLVYLQRGLFTSFLSKRQGDIGQLVTALDR
ncbi:MAG: ABC transporter substrate-binding protein [Hyphomicrobiales bacterium]